MTLDRTTHNGHSAATIWQRCQRYRVDHIVQAVADEARMSTEEACGASKSRRITAARNAVWTRLRELGWSVGEIGALWDRDQSAVSHAMRRGRKP